MSQEILIPPLKWAGGKRWLVSNQSEVFPTEFNRYFEPFLGGGAVFFATAPAQAILSDANKELVEFYQCLRNDWKRLWNLMVKHQLRHSDRYYYKVRASRPKGKYERASRFLYLNRTCWNGLYRVNLNGQFNVPRGTKDTVTLDTDDFPRLSKALAQADIHHSDFESIMDQAEAGDFVYVDPPYTVKHNHNGFIKYNENLFSWDDQVRLRNAVGRCVDRGVQVLISNADHHSITELYKGLHTTTLLRRSTIAANSLSRNKTSELFIRSWS